jgi:hypothetical protein
MQVESRCPGAAGRHQPRRGLPNPSGGLHVCKRRLARLFAVKDRECLFERQLQRRELIDLD